MTDRLDRIERILELHSEQMQASGQQFQMRMDALDARMDRMAEQQAEHRAEQIQWNREANERMDRFQLEMEQSRREANERMSRVEQAQQASNERMDRMEHEMNSNFEYIGSELGQLIRGLAELRQQVSALAQAVEQDRSQAIIDRAEFRSTVEQLLQVLTQRFTSNGGS